MNGATVLLEMASNVYGSQKCSGEAFLQFCGHVPYHKYYPGYASAEVAQEKNASNQLRDFQMICHLHSVTLLYLNVNIL